MKMNHPKAKEIRYYVEDILPFFHRVSKRAEELGFNSCMINVHSESKLPTNVVKFNGDINAVDPFKVHVYTGKTDGGFYCYSVSGISD